MSYGLTAIIILAALGILCARQMRVRNELQRRVGEDDGLIANRNAVLLIGEHFILPDRHALPAPRSTDDGQAEGTRSVASGKRLLKIAS